MELAKEGIEDIIYCWYKGININCLNNMIYYWIKKNKIFLHTIPEIKDIFKRIKSLENNRLIVEDFIFGEKYQSLREMFL
jgi:hypothetical protein